MVCYYFIPNVTIYQNGLLSFCFELIAYKISHVVNDINLTSLSPTIVLYNPFCYEVKIVVIAHEMCV